MSVGSDFKDEKLSAIDFAAAVAAAVAAAAFVSAAQQLIL